MPPKCVLFYKTDRTNEQTEAALDREAGAGGIVLLGVSAPKQSAVPEGRRDLPFIAPETLSGVDFDYVIVTGDPPEAKRDQTRSRVKRLFPPFLLRLYFRLSAWFFGRKKVRRWKDFDGWGKSIERRKDMCFPERSALGEWNIPAEKIIPERTLHIPGFCMEEYTELRKRGVTLLSDNCWGGLMYHTLGMELRSPFINMFVNVEDFVRLISDLPHYLALPLVPEKLCVRRGGAIAYPIVMLGDIPLHFNHVSSPEELAVYAEKWYRRRDRMDWDTIYVESCFTAKEEQEEFSDAFAGCPYPRLIFTPYPDEQSVYLSAFSAAPRRYKGDFGACTRDLAKNEYPGEMPLDILQTLLMRTVRPPKRPE